MDCAVATLLVSPGRLVGHDHASNRGTPCLVTKRTQGIRVIFVGTGKRETFRIHLGLVLAELVCISAFIFEMSRALSGNTLSWAYVVEWPILGAYAVYVWRKLLREERADDDEAAASVVAVQPDDPELRAWNDYLARVHESDQV